jgi:DNA-binding transcriptional regulator YdaS (Cro superfamily)
MNKGLQAAIEKAGTRYALAKALSLDPSSVLRWKKIPYDRILKIERVLGIERSILAPKLFEGYTKTCRNIEAKSHWPTSSRASASKTNNFGTRR